MEELEKEARKNATDSLVSNLENGVWIVVVRYPESRKKQKIINESIRSMLKRKYILKKYGEKLPKKIARGVFEVYSFELAKLMKSRCIKHYGNADIYFAIKVNFSLLPFKKV